MPGGRALAVAVIRHPPAGGERAYSHARATVRSYATAEGYDLAELFEAFGPEPIDRATVQVLLDLADRIDARTVLTFGDIGEVSRNSIAARSDLRIVPVPEEPDTSTAPRGLPVIPAPLSRRTTDGVVSTWTGRLKMDLLNGRGWRVATLDLVVRIDSLTLWWGNRTLAVIDRDIFKQWAHHPGRTLQTDDVTWSTQGGTGWICVDGSTPYVVPSNSFQYLLTVI